MQCRAGHSTIWSRSFSTYHPMADFAAMIAACLPLILPVLLLLDPFYLPHFACMNHFCLPSSPQGTCAAVPHSRLSFHIWLQCINFIWTVLQVRPQCISHSYASLAGLVAVPEGDLALAVIQFSRAKAYSWLALTAADLHFVQSTCMLLRLQLSFDAGLVAVPEGDLAVADSHLTLFSAPSTPFVYSSFCHLCSSLYAAPSCYTTNCSMHPASLSCRSSCST